MKKDIFKKKFRTLEGREYFRYFTEMTKPDGENILVEVKFKQTCKAPECPATIEIEQEAASMQKKTVNDKIYYTLWVSNYTELEYVDETLKGWT